ncbi:hypothetical protein JCM3775_003447 [Rhodotorula graminis]
MSSASLRLTEPCVFLVGGLDWERARQRQRRAAQRAANAANTPTNAGGTASATVDSPSQSRHPSPDRDRGSRAASLSRPGSRAASPAPRGRLGELAQQGTDEFIPPNSRGRSHSRTRQPTPTGNRTHSLSRGRDGSLVRDMTDAQLALQHQRDEREDLDEPPPALLRGLLTVHLSKPTRIKDISVRFKGTARTDWPEGIGPRRLDVMEETQLINVTQSFFSASSASMQRRAASIGPGAGDHGDESRGRSTRRAASVVPGRQVSQGRSYPRDSVFQQHELAPVPLHQHAPEVARAPGLSRISSEEDLGDHRIPPVLPGEAAPSYEVAVDSAPGSPMHHPVSSNHSVDTLDLGSGLSTAFRGTHHRLERSPTPSRSPLATSNPITSPVESPSSSSNHLPLARTTTRASRLSHDSTETVSSAHSSGTDRPPLDRQLSSGTGTSNTASLSSDPERHGPGWQSAPVPGSTASSFGRGRSPDRQSSSASGATDGVDGATSGVAGMTFQSRQSMAPAPASATGTDRRRRPSSSSAATTRRLSSNTERPSALPSALKSNSGSSGGSGGGGGGGRSASRGARFTLSGITEVLRGKSSSRARNGNANSNAAAVDEAHAPVVARRTSSPDARAGSSSSRMRSQSRGRKTALKALRDALVVGHHSSHGERDGSDEDRHGAGGSEVVGDGWKEFKAGTYTYPISITVPATLPPSLTCEFGHVGYTLKATVHRAGALTTNLTSSTEVTLVTTPGEEDTEESESIVVERFWETQVKYHVALSGKSFPIGGQIPISIRLNPLAKIRLYRVTAQLEQKTSYFASVNSGRKLTRHETPKRFQLLRIENKDPKEPLLPILSDDPDVLLNHPLREFFINASSSDDDTPSLLDPIGPWHLDGLLQLPDCSSKLCVSTHHEKSNISISHTLKIMMRVERGDDDYLDSKGNRKLWDIVVEAGAVMLSCRLAQNILPAYSDATPSLAGPSGSSSRSSRNNASSRGATHDCGASHPPPLTRAANMHIGMGSSTTHRSHSSTAAPIATLEQNLLLARLIAGETTPAGETPPTYDAVVDGTAPLGRGRATEVVEVETEEVERGRSSSTRRGTARA